MGLTEPEQEILNFGNSQAKLGVRVTVKALLEKFETKPYGWPTAAVLCITASLIARNKLEARSDGTLLEGSDLEKALRNSNLLANIVLTPQVEFQPSQIKRLRDFYKDFFDAPVDGNDAKVLAAETAAGFDKVRRETELLLAQEDSFPFLAALRDVSSTLAQVSGKPAAWYLTDLAPFEDKLLDAKEEILDPIRAFMGGPQRTIYDEISKFLKAHAANFQQVGAAEAEAIRKALADPACYKGAKLQNLKTGYHALKDRVDLKIIEERKAVEAEIATCKAKIEALPEIEKLSSAQRAAVLSPIERASQGLGDIVLIAVLRNHANDIRTTLYPALLEEVIHLARPVEAPQPEPGLGEGGAPPPTPPRLIKRQDIRITFAKSILSSDSDVDAYVEGLRTAMLAEINAGKEIIV
ncbi:hypothetical protein ACFQY9_05560 [Microvirga aerilata]|uniref:hypothetical protein n=1 Tax=Microvirga aerilata TaxID=670292 RepID=UPI003630F803